jgi:signal transduction histidine kinase
VVKKKNEIGDLSRAISDLTDRIIDYRTDLNVEILERKNKEKESEVQRKRAEFYLDLLSHDIGNLHQGIHTSLMINNMSSISDEKRSRALDLAQESVRRSMTLVRNILLLSKVRYSKPSLEKINLQDSLEEAKRHIISMFPTKEIDFDINTPDKDIVILAEPIVEQMFLNLFHNGIKFQINDRAKMNVDIERNEKNGTVIVDIKDYGEGIPDNNKSKIFQRFESAGGEEKEGTGLGLHLVRELAERYNATINVMDRVKGDHTKGSMFRIMFHGQVGDLVKYL